MKFGIMLPNYARWFRDDALWQVCLRGKEIGLNAFSFVDHIIVTRNQYAGFGNGYMDIWTAMSYVAAITNVQGWKPILTQSVVDIRTGRLCSRRRSRRRSILSRMGGS